MGAVRSVAAGHTYVSPAIVTRMVDTYVRRSPDASLDDPYESLTRARAPGPAPRRPGPHEPRDRPVPAALRADRPLQPGQRDGEARPARPRRAAALHHPPRPAEPVVPMSTGRRLAGFWDSVRPRTRRGGILAVVAILGGAVALSVALFVGVAMAWNPYLDYTLNRTSTPGSGRSCRCPTRPRAPARECHAEQQAHLASATHAGIGCQSCHGALLEHAASGSEAVSAKVPVAVPDGRGLRPLPLGSHGPARRVPPDRARPALRVVLPRVPRPAHRASRTGRRWCCTRSRTCRPASPATVPRASRPATSATPPAPRTTSAASTATPPAAAPPNVKTLIPRCPHDRPPAPRDARPTRAVPDPGPRPAERRPGGRDARPARGARARPSRPRPPAAARSWASAWRSRAA